MNLEKGMIFLESILRFRKGTYKKFLNNGDLYQIGNLELRGQKEG